jgi:hypothetical protein
MPPCTTTAIITDTAAALSATAAGASIATMGGSKAPKAPAVPATPPSATPATMATTSGGGTAQSKGAAAALAQQSIGTSQQGILTAPSTGKAVLLGG